MYFFCTDGDGNYGSYSYFTRSARLKNEIATIVRLGFFFLQTILKQVKNKKEEATIVTFAN